MIDRRSIISERLSAAAISPADTHPRDSQAPQPFHSLYHRRHSFLIHNRKRLLNRADPSRTMTLRNRFASDMTRRLKAIQSMIYDAVVVKDVFGLEGKGPLEVLVDSGLPPRAFAFKTDPQKIEGFMEWLEKKVNEGVLDVSQGQARKVAGNARWANLYIDSAYKQGMRRADEELRRAARLPQLPPIPKTRMIDAAFATPFHADRVALIYSRMYSELKNITSTMENEISSTLAQAMAEGRNPRQIARQLMNRVEQAGGDLAIRDDRGAVRMRPIQRARILARTEIMRAHHVASINTYKEAGVEGVMVQVEWVTAGDDRVCPECEGLSGRVFSLEEIEPLIPAHPQCRCVAVPVVDKVIAARLAGMAQKVAAEDLLHPVAQFIRPSLPFKKAELPKVKKVRVKKEAPGTPPSTRTIKGGEPIRSRILSKDEESLSRGVVLEHKELNGGINEARLVTFSGKPEAKGVVKWEATEQTHWSTASDPKLTAAMREKMAYDLSERLGIKKVPFVEYRDVTVPKTPLKGKASVMKWVKDAHKGDELYSLGQISDLDRLKAGIFDVVSGHADRHVQNYMVQYAGGLDSAMMVPSTQKGLPIVLIDNGFSFPPMSALGRMGPNMWRGMFGGGERIKGQIASMGRACLQDRRACVDLLKGLREFKVQEWVKSLPAEIQSKISTNILIGIETRRRVAADLLEKVLTADFNGAEETVLAYYNSSHAQATSGGVAYLRKIDQYQREAWKLFNKGRA